MSKDGNGSTHSAKRLTSPRTVRELVVASDDIGPLETLLANGQPNGVEDSKYPPAEPGGSSCEPLKASSSDRYAVTCEHLTVATLIQRQLIQRPIDVSCNPLGRRASHCGALRTACWDDSRAVPSSFAECYYRSP